MAYEAAIAAIPGLIQTTAGIAQTAKGRKMSRGLTDPIYDIPQSAIDALELAHTRVGNFQPPGYEAYINNLNQIQAGTQTAINRSATSANEALGSTLAANAQQLKSLNDYQGFAEGNYAERQRNLQGALGTMAGYENNKWENDINQAFLRKALAAQSLIGAGVQNTYQGTSDTAGALANYMEGTAEDRAEKRRLAEQEKIAERRLKTAGQIQFTPDDNSGNLTAPQGELLPAIYASNESMITPDTKAMDGFDEWMAQAYGNPVNFQTNNNGIWP